MPTRTSPDPTLNELQLLGALNSLAKGDFTVRLPLDGEGVELRIASAFNDAVELNQRLALELGRMARVVGKDGRLSERARIGDVEGSWAATMSAVNELVEDMVRPVREMARVVGAVERGNLDQRAEIEPEGCLLAGEFLRTARIVNTMVDTLATFSREVTRVVREVGLEGKLGGQALVPAV